MYFHMMALLPKLIYNVPVELINVAPKIQIKIWLVLDKFLCSVSPWSNGHEAFIK